MSFSSSNSPVEEKFDSLSFSNTIFMCSLYLFLGTVAIFANATNIFIFLTNKELRKTQIYAIILDFGEIVNGLALILTSSGRATKLFLGELNTPVSVHDCFFNRYWPVPLLLGTEIPAVMAMLTSMERIIAVHKPMQYSTFYSLKLKIFYVFCSILFLSGSMTWAGLSAWNNQRQTSTQHCSIVLSTTKAYSTFHFAFVLLAYVCSFCSLCFIALLQNERNQNSKNNFRQRQLTTYTVMTAIDIILVTIPSFVLCGANYGLFKPNDIIHGLSYSTSGFLSLCHIGVNIGYNREYRKQLKILFGETKCHWQKLNITNATSFWTTNNKVIVM